MSIRIGTSGPVRDLVSKPLVYMTGELIGIDLSTVSSNKRGIKVSGVAGTLRFVEVRVLDDGSLELIRDLPEETRFDADPTLEYGVVSMSPSHEIDDCTITLTADANSTSWRFTFVELSLDADIDRDSKIDTGDVRKQSWQWGPNGHGAIVLVNNDRDITSTQFGWRDRLDDRRNGPLDIKDLAQLSLKMNGPPQLPAGYGIRLAVTDASAAKLRLFSLVPGAVGQLIGPGKGRHTIPYQVGTLALGMEALQYPDYGFTGLLTIQIFLSYMGSPIGGDTLVFRVAPWIAPHPLLPPEKLYVCVEKDNVVFRTDIAKVAAAAGVAVVEVPLVLNRGDRWIQDEIEIGYSRSPNKTFPVVLDGPRDRGLDDMPETMLLGPDFGWVTRGDDGVPGDSLNSFGNLDCTPPVPGFPLGRIIIGAAGPSDDTRQMMKAVTDFLWAQRVQRPIELYSSWLGVGHVDEFMAFVPASTLLGFKLVLASPQLAFRILKDLKAAGHGENRMLVDRWTESQGTGTSLEGSVTQYISDEVLRASNARFQSNIDWNRNKLKLELGLTEDDIVDVPVIYSEKLGGADALTGNLTNMVLLGRHLIVPKPFGPIINGACAFESAISDILAPLDITVHAVDTWYSYHLLAGGAHCGTNVLRTPHKANWWDVDPERGTKV